MCNNDSWNDSDEDFSLYSSKNITKTFNAQLQKLLNGNAGLTKKCSDTDTNDILQKEECLVNLNEDSLTYSDKTGDSEGTGTDIQIVDHELIEIIDVPSNNSVRRSERIRTKTGRGRHHSSISNPSTTTTTAKKKRRKNNTNDTDNSIQSRSPTITLDDTLDLPLDLDDEEELNAEFSTTQKKQKKNSKNHTQNLIHSRSPTIVLEDSLDLSLSLDEEELNPEISVKVKWKSIMIKKFMVRKFQKMSTIYEQLSKEENVPENRILLTFNNCKVNHTDTPSSLNLQIVDFLDGGVLNEATSSDTSVTPNQTFDNDDSTVVLKFQDSSKNTKKLSVNKNDKIKIVMIKYAEQVEVQLRDIKFYFDGELIDPNDTASSIGLETDDIIDIKICHA